MSGLAGLGLGARLIGVRSALAKIPPKAWLAIGCAVALLLGVLLHQHIAHKRLKAADAAGYARAQAEDAKVIAAMRARAQTAEANGLKISQEVRTRNDTEARNINASAAALSLRGPGAASCRRIGNPAVPATASGPEPTGGAPSPSAAPVLADNGLAAVPWDWLVNTGREADLDRSEALAWRTWYARQVAEWEKLRTKPAH